MATSVLLAALLGYLMGWALNRLSDRLPHYLAMTPFSTSTDNPSGFTRRASLIIGSITAAYFTVTFARFGFTAQWILAVGSFAFFLLVALIDLKYRLVLNLMVYPAIILMVLVHVLALRQDLLQTVLGGLLAFGMFAVVAWRRPGQLGGGDIKLATLIGITFGFPNVLWALLGAALTSAAFIAYVMFAQHGTLKTRIPYAPFLCTGAICSVLIILAA